MEVKRLLVCIHGIGFNTRNYTDKLKKSLPADWLVVEACWGDIVDPMQREAILKMKKLGNSWFRSKILDTVGDAIAYQQTKDHPNYYQDINRYLVHLLNELGIKYPDAEITLIAHSLGGIITSNLLWDAMEYHSKGNHTYKTYNNVSSTVSRRIKHFITLGSPFALYSQQFPLGGEALRLKDTDVTWHNFWNKSDLLSSPFELGGKPVINKSYLIPNIISCEIKFGSIFSSWNILNHLYYWKDKVVIDKIKEVVS